MINFISFLDIFRNNIQRWAQEVKCKGVLEVSELYSQNNPDTIIVRFRLEERILDINVDRLEFDYNPETVSMDMFSMVSDFAAPRKSCIGTAAMPKNQVPFNKTPRRIKWKGHTIQDWFDHLDRKTNSNIALDIESQILKVVSQP